MMIKMIVGSFVVQTLTRLVKLDIPPVPSNFHLFSKMRHSNELARLFFPPYAIKMPEINRKSRERIALSL